MKSASWTLGSSPREAVAPTLDVELNTARLVGRQALAVGPPASRSSQIGFTSFSLGPPLLRYLPLDTSPDDRFSHERPSNPFVGAIPPLPAPSSLYPASVSTDHELSQSLPGAVIAEQPQSQETPYYDKEWLECEMAEMAMRFHERQGKFDIPSASRRSLQCVGQRHIPEFGMSYTYKDGSSCPTTVSGRPVDPNRGMATSRKEAMSMSNREKFEIFSPHLKERSRMESRELPQDYVESNNLVPLMPDLALRSPSTRSIQHSNSFNQEQSSERKPMANTWNYWSGKSKSISMSPGLSSALAQSRSRCVCDTISADWTEGGGDMKKKKLFALSTESQRRFPSPGFAPRATFFE